MNYRLITQLEEFSLDIGLVAGVCSNTDIESRLWLEDELCLFCAPEHPLAPKKILEYRDLQNAQWVLREKNSGTLEVLMGALANEIHSFNVIAEMNNTETIKRAVKIGLGISCLSRMAIKDELKSGELVEIKTPSLHLTRNHYILIHQNKHKSQIISAFLNYCIYSKQIKKVFCLSWKWRNTPVELTS